jgi:hypothetical protein
MPAWSETLRELRSTAGMIFRRRIRRNRFAGLDYYGETEGATSGLGLVVAGPLGSNYPLSSTAAAGGAALTLNAVISAMNAKTGGILLIAGGAGTTHYLETTLVPLENVNLWSDGAVLSAMNGATFSPLIGNSGSQTLTNLEFLNLTTTTNGNNSGFTAQAVTPTTATPVLASTLTGVTGGSIVLAIASGGNVTHVRINQLTDANSNLPLSGPWFLKPTDTITLTFSGGQTFTSTQQIDLWHTIQTHGCHFIACTFNSGSTASQTGAGVALWLGYGSAQISASNEIDINSSATKSVFACGMILQGNTAGGGQTANNQVFHFDVAGCLYRGIDIDFADTNIFHWCRAPHGGSLGGYVGLWLGSTGTSSTGSPCDRCTWDDLILDSASTSTDNPIVFGYYNGPAPLPSPSTQIRNLFHAGAGTSVLDLRSPAINDYFIQDVSSAKLYGPNVASFEVNGITNQLGVMLPIFGTGGGSGTFTPAAGTYQMCGCGDFSGSSGISVPLIFTPALTGKIKLTIRFTVKQSAAADGWTAHAKFGTTTAGTGPVQQASETGTTSGSNATTTTTVANELLTVTIVTIFNATVGTQYWADLAITSVTAGNVTVTAIDGLVEERSA